MSARSAPNADPSAVRAIGQSDLATIGERLMEPLADQVGVRVNPRYGTWDEISLRVVPTGEFDGAILPA